MMETRLHAQQKTAPPPSLTVVPNGLLQRKCACGGPAGFAEECEGCSKQNLSLQRSTRSSESETRNSGGVPPIVREVLRTSGQPLDAETRDFMEPRFGHDFSRVRVHTDANAAASASTVNALAYTVGRDVVFGNGQYAPQSLTGQRLLAHELAHVVQQRSGTLQANTQIGAPHDPHEQEADRVAVAVMESKPGGRLPPSMASLGTIQIQRTCGDAALGPPTPDCTRRTQDDPGEVFYFVVDCDDPEAGEVQRLECFAIGLPAGTVLKVHGYASTDGDTDYNWRLSCHRANKIATLLHGFRPDLTLLSPNFKHGPAVGPAPYRRSVVVETTPPQPASSGRCGPEATAWFVTQVNMAMTDGAVLAVQAHMATADALAATHGTTAQAVAEGGAAGRVTSQVASMAAAGTPAPPITPRAASDVAAGGAAGGVAAMALVPHPFDLGMISREVLAAATGWRLLVNHGARYDFKAHTMQRPSTSCCPLAPCTDSITLCAGMAPQNCYLTDLPGNLFYALIGRFVGFSERTLQLGSQFAQLTGTGTWDPPQDTAAIALGFRLPLPLSAAGLCGLLVAARGGLNTKPNCPDCRQPTTAAFR